jgi:hypothetical protein
MLQLWHGILEVLDRVSFIWGSLGFIRVVGGELTHGAASATFDAAEFAPDTFTQSNCQPIGSRAIARTVTLSPPCGIKDLVHGQGGADADRSVVERVS